METDSKSPRVTLPVTISAAGVEIAGELGNSPVALEIAKRTVFIIFAHGSGSSR